MSGGPRLEGQTGTPVYMTTPPEPGWFAKVGPHGLARRMIEVRVENDVLWLRDQHPGGHWSKWRRMQETEEAVGG